MCNFLKSKLGGIPASNSLGGKEAYSAVESYYVDRVTTIFLGIQNIPPNTD